MNALQRHALGVWWKIEVFLLLLLVLGLATANPVLTACTLGAMLWLLWPFWKDWKEARRQDDWY